MTGGLPLALPSVNHTEPVPRRIGPPWVARVVVDTTAALYLWEWPHYPQYYIPLGDIDPASSSTRSTNSSSAGPPSAVRPTGR